MKITNEEKKILLQIARNAIESLFNKKPPDDLNLDDHPVFKTKAGAFVTLTEFGELRGCIGYIIGHQPLIETVREAAVQAAQNDPRFFPLNETELSKINIEISVLSEPFPLNSYNEIELGVHGLILEEQGRRALLLPQVPIEHGMNREEYLSSLCQKGGFNSGLWREKQLNLSAFTAKVFSETNLEGSNDD